MDEDGWVTIPPTQQSNEMPSSLISFVKEVEGYSPRAYSDYKQYSIGWGTKASGPGEVIDEQEAERRLQDELAGHYKRVSSAANSVGAKFTPEQLGALTSFDYNTGQGAYLVESSKGDIDNITSRMPQYRLAGGEVLPGLEKRRQKELEFFHSGEGKPSGEEGEWITMPAPDAGHGSEVPEVAASEPKGSVSQGPTYLPDDQLKGKMVKIRTTDPGSGESIEEETDAMTAQSFIKGNIDTYTTLMDCLSKS